MLEAAAYWRTPLKPMMGSRQLTEFYVLDAEAAVPQGERSWQFSCGSLVLGQPLRGVWTLAQAAVCQHSMRIRLWSACGTGPFFRSSVC